MASLWRLPLDNSNKFRVDEFIDFLEPTMLSAIKNYVLYGLPPGSCTEAIICGDIDGARMRAHPVLLQGDMFEAMCEFTNQCLPEEMLGPVNYHIWRSHQGWEDAPLDEKVRIRFVYEDKQWYEWIEESLDKS